MKKIATVFERDWDGDRSRVLDRVTPGCEWVVAGEGVPTIKYDGTACLIRDGRMYRRMEVKPAKPKRGEPWVLTVTPPAAFEEVDSRVNEHGQVILTGWFPVTDGPEDVWHREGFEKSLTTLGLSDLPDGTYELVGPKIQGNPEGFEEHRLIRHEAAGVLVDVPRTFDGLREWFAGRNAEDRHGARGRTIEGIVFHHPDGRMAKIKSRDFGIKRPKEIR